MLFLKKALENKGYSLFVNSKWHEPIPGVLTMLTAGGFPLFLPQEMAIKKKG